MSTQRANCKRGGTREKVEVFPQQRATFFEAGKSSGSLAAFRGCGGTNRRPASLQAGKPSGSSAALEVGRVP